MPGQAMPWVKLQFFDSNGDPAASYRVFFYDAGTSTKRDTFSDSALTTPNTNPVTLDSAGRASIFWSPTTYKVVFAAPGSDDPPSSPVWTMDNIPALSGFAANVDVAGTAGENLTAGNAAYLSSGIGGGTAGRWYKADADSAQFIPDVVHAFSVGFVLADATSGNSCSIRTGGRVTGLSGLTAGAAQYVSTTAGGLTSTDPGSSTVLSVVIGVADSTTSLVIAPILPYLTVGGTAAGPGSNHTVVSTDTQTWTGAKYFQTSAFVGAGSNGTTYGRVGGLVLSDVTEYSIPQNSTDTVMTDTTIAANVLDANGKAIRLNIGLDTDETGTNTHIVELDVGGTQVPIRASSGTALSYWASEVLLIRIDSDTLEVRAMLATPSAVAYTVQRINSLDFAASIALRTLGTTGATTTTGQTHFLYEIVG